MRDISERAAHLHRQCILIDGHNDVLFLKCVRNQPLAFVEVQPEYNSDAPRLIQGGLTAAMCMVDGHHLHRSMALLEQTLEEIATHPERLVLVRKTADIRRAKRTGQLGIILTWESLMALGNDLAILPLARRLGIRACALTHGEGGVVNALQTTPSPFEYCTKRDREVFRRTHGGLTPFGRSVVQAMNRLGLLIDVAHANDATFEDVLELSEKPVVSTHGGVFALCPHSRCSTDWQIRALAQKGGLLSIAFYDAFLAQHDASVDSVVDHMAYVAELVGAEHVAVGSDFDGLPSYVKPVVPSADRLHILTEAMVRRGFSDNEIRLIWGGNYLRVLRKTIDVPESNR